VDEANGRCHPQARPDAPDHEGDVAVPRRVQDCRDQLDFVSPHLYPKTGKVDDEIKLLIQFDWGKPIVIGETFP